MSVSITLLVTSGNGPEECCQAVAHVLARMKDEAVRSDVDLDVSATASKHGVQSALVVVHGPLASRIADAWCGTVQWICKSDLRTRHKRQNWFVGVSRLPDVMSFADTGGALRFETFRAGGPGGQHQNTTDSAVRATCETTGVSVVVRDGRSQHRNKALAIERINALKALQQKHELALRARNANQSHNQLERGNAKRVFRGRNFVETS
ncbi:peptide chain release factor H [Halocynthiibacter namhaensis]|uniref:peptide chain release factor H n=1 Tax=Halocynthiibacter namhaensis TaxID=1290553 RepID=UPI0005797189|nr:peptide chain release factor H [Halocynthiibacter namhaensis]